MPKSAKIVIIRPTESPASSAALPRDACPAALPLLVRSRTGSYRDPYGCSLSSVGMRCLASKDNAAGTNLRWAAEAVEEDEEEDGDEGVEERGAK